MKLNTYFLTARVTPALLTSIPIIAIPIAVDDKILTNTLNQIISLKSLGAISGSGALWMFLVFVNRYISKKVLETKQFNSELDFPTTRFLLHRDTTFSQAYKKKIHDQIHKNFKMEIPSADIEMEKELESRKLISEAVGLIRARIKDGRLLLQHNMEYGFYRNLVGGSIIGAIASFVNVGIYLNSSNITLACLFSIFAIAYVTLFMLRNSGMEYFGQKYAKVLFQEYVK